MADQSITVSAPGKIIISGEHSVVYGQPALVSAIDKRLYVTIEKGNSQTKIITDQNPQLAYYALSKIQETLGKKLNHFKIKIRSEIPVNRGLGSSSALAVALTGVLFRWFGKKWSNQKINQIAFEIEKKQHHSPSGVDNAIVTFGGLIIFQKGKIKFPKIYPDPEGHRDPKLALNLFTVSLPNLPKGFLLIDSGQAIESTAEMVAHVKERCRVSRGACRTIEKLGQTTLKIIESLKFHPDPPAGGRRNLISQNQRLLEKLGVVGQKAKEIIRQIESLGGAAKICGAGGLKNGSGVLLCYHQTPPILLKFAQRNNLKSYQLKLGEEGLRDEN